jgi:ketosteroid isomerase-like protein
MDSEHPNAILVRGHYEALAAGDMALVFGGWHDDVVFHYYGNNERRGDYAGKMAVMQFLASLATGSGGTFRLDPGTIASVGDELVVQEVQISMTWDGHSVAGPGVVISRVIDAKVTEIWDIPASTVGLPTQ